MTDRFNALSALVMSGHELAQPALARFHALFKGRRAGAGQMVCPAGRQHRPRRQRAARRQGFAEAPDFHIRTPTARAA